MTETRVVHVNDQVEGAVYIGRKSWQGTGKPWLKESPFANPFRITQKTSRATAITRFEEHLVKHPELWTSIPELRGKPLACWCRHDGARKTPNNACHGDVLVELLERYTDDELRAMGGAF